VEPVAPEPPESRSARLGQSIPRCNPLPRAATSRPGVTTTQPTHGATSLPGGAGALASGPGAPASGAGSPPVRGATTLTPHRASITQPPRGATTTQNRIEWHGAPSRQATHFRPGQFLAAAYLPGGIGMALVGSTPIDRSLGILGGLAAGAWILLLAVWSLGLGSIQAVLPVKALLVGTLFATILACALGAYALVRAAADPRFHPGELPNWLRRPALAGLMGMLVPGLGLIAAGHARRAALALVVAFFMLPALVLATHPTGLALANARAAAQGVPAYGLDLIVMAAIAGLALGSLLWLGGALDGARLVRFRGGSPGVPVADRLFLVLLGSLALLPLAMRPADLASSFDRTAEQRHAEGYGALPLLFEMGAMRLDPSRPEYALRAADRFEDLGQDVPAAAIRQSLRERWQAYLDNLPDARPSASTAQLGTPPDGREKVRPDSYH
jgi:hypothetical protein